MSIAQNDVEAAGGVPLHDRQIGIDECVVGVVKHVHSAWSDRETFGFGTFLGYSIDLVIGELFEVVTVEADIEARHNHVGGGEIDPAGVACLGGGICRQWRTRRWIVIAEIMQIIQTHRDFGPGRGQNGHRPIGRDRPEPGTRINVLVRIIAADRRRDVNFHALVKNRPPAHDHGRELQERPPGKISNAGSGIGSKFGWAGGGEGCGDIGKR